MGIIVIDHRQLADGEEVVVFKAAPRIEEDDFLVGLEPPGREKLLGRFRPRSHVCLHVVTKVSAKPTSHSRWDLT